MECRRNIIHLGKYSCATFVCDSCKCEGGRTLDSFLSIDIQCSDSYASTCASVTPPSTHLAPSFFEKVQIRSSGGPEFWVIRKVRDPQDLIFKTQDLWFQPLIEVLSLHCPPILNFPCAGIPESPKMYQPRQNHHIPQMNKNSSYVKKI